MLDQSEIDALLSSASDLVVEAGNEIGAPGAGPGNGPRGRPTIKIDRAELERVLSMRFPVIVSLAQRELPMEDVLDLTVGSIIEFDRPADAELDLMVGNRRIGAGQAVKVGEYFGLRVSSAGRVKDRIRALGR